MNLNLNKLREIESNFIYTLNRDHTLNEIEKELTRLGITNSKDIKIGYSVENHEAYIHYGPKCYQELQDKFPEYFI